MTDHLEKYVYIIKEHYSVPLNTLHKALHKDPKIIY